MSGDGYMEARFGPAGNAVAFSERYQSSLDAPAWIAGLGLDCYEYQCGKGVRIGQDTAEKLGERARQAEIALFLLSNSRKPGRPHSFAQKLDIPCIGHAGKPKRGGFFRAMERIGVTPDQTVMVGDQIFTDVLGANRSGVTPLLVKPIRLAGNPGRYIRYAVETPFRLLGRWRPFV